MKKIFTALVACGALLAATAPAQAAPKDPVHAVKAVLAPGHGGHFTETATLLDGTIERAERRRKGVFELDEKGSVKSLDVTTTGGEDGRERAIGINHTIGGTSYQSGGLVGKWLRNGKTWWQDAHQERLHHTSLLGADEQLINPAEPATLTALLKNGQPSENTVTGAITFKELAKVSPRFAHSSHSSWGDDDTKLSYTLTLTSVGLTSRVQSMYTLPGGPDELVGKTLHVDTRYSQWGAKVSIKVPDRRTTTSELCLGGELCKWRLPS
ncbi:hypothetical protein AB0M44_28975 [Streptosporangium subroseum]|uniref:hypothetical protein n=1 Tax=Streptosporangium subroseum TaxID=106412 RepID=UPI00342A9553